MEKLCSSCNILKPFDSFYKDKSGKFGLRADCKDCVKEKKRNYYLKSADQVKERTKNWKEMIKREGSLPYWNVRASKLNDRAKRCGIEDAVSGFEIMEIYNESDGCFYCKYPVTHDQCHIDHIIPLIKGGMNHISNLVVSCSYCNLHKSDKTIDDEKIFFEYIENIYKKLYPKYR